MLRPRDIPRPSLGQGDRGTRDLEVEEVVGVDGREALGVPLGGEVAQGGGGGLGGVVPSLESADHGRSPQLRPLLPVDGSHGAKLADRLRHGGGLPIHADVTVVEDLVFLQGISATKQTLRKWNESPWRVIGVWAAWSLLVAIALLGAVYFVARISQPD